MNRIEPTTRTTVKRLPKRAEYDRDVIHAILDEAFVCHVGFVADGQPFVIPTAFARDGEWLYLHGSAVSRMLKTLAGGVDLCVTVTLVDGLVLARSAFHHSINYRSVVLLGKASVVEDGTEKTAALRVFTDHIIPARWPEVREPDPQELKATMVLRMPIKEASAKIRTGPPVDDESDLTRNVWAGVLPLRVTPGDPQRDAYCGPEIPVPENVRNYKR